MQLLNLTRLFPFLLALLLVACSGGSSGSSDTNSTSEADISSPADGSIFAENDSISFVGTGSDTEDGVLTGSSLTWSSSLDGSLGTDTTVSATLSVGSHIITLTVTDSGGATGSSTINVIVNAAPVVGSASVSPDPVNIGVSTTFSWSASDPDGDTLTCLLDVDGDGMDDYTVSDCGNSTSQAHTYTAAGSYLARLTVSDGVNASVQQSVNVTVTDPDPGNVSPQISSFNASPDALPIGGSANFSWAVSDADGDTLTCSLDADGDGSNDYTITDCVNNSTQAHTYAQAGTYEAKLTVSDGSNAPVEQSKAKR